MSTVSTVHPQTQAQDTGNWLNRYWNWGIRSRRELIPTVRKVYFDFRKLADREPEGREILGILEGIAGEVDRWYETPSDESVLNSECPEPLPAGLALPVEEVAQWAKGMNELYVTLGHLGTYCHFQLKEKRREAAVGDGIGKDPLLSPEAYEDLKQKNLLLNDLEILLGRTSLASYPNRLALDPTNDCNLRCRGCRHGITKDFHHTELRRDYVEVLAEAFPFADYMYPQGTGEATMSSMLPLLIAEAGRHRVKVDMLTNGTIIEKTDLPWGQFFRLGISVDGASEETMRALRPIAPLAHVLKELRWLREKAPQATIYTKVTVSRLNYPEIPALVEILADAGAHEVIVHSLEVHDPVHAFIQVKGSDRQHMMECVEEGRRVAERRGIAFVNALNFEGAARQEEPLDRPAMLQILKETPLPVLKIRKLPALLEELRAAKFAYYPDSYLRQTGKKPSSNAADARWMRPEAARLDTIDGLIRDLAAEVRALRPEKVQIPYCFILWKMSIVEADGRAKACCHLGNRLGDLDEGSEFQDFWSGPGYAALRESMFRVEKMPARCAGCQEIERSLFAEGTIAVADLLGVPVRRAPRYPVPMDVKALFAKAKGQRAGFEVMGARQEGASRFVIPPGGQILARFPNPETASGVYYQGEYSIRGGRLLVGVKPLWSADLWHRLMEPRVLNTLGGWVSLPMPPLTIDFASREESECCLFLWAPGDNAGDVTLDVRGFSGVLTAAGASYGDALQNRHFWSGTDARDAVSCVES